MMEPKEQEITIETKDGRTLSGLLVEPEEPRISVIVSPAVAIPKERYLNFAKAGAARGAAVLLYDYRAQGASVQGDIRKDLAGFGEWGRLDMPAAIRRLDQLHPKLEMVGVHHSVGGWIMGLADNHDRLSRNAFVCVGWGYWKLKPLPFRYVEMFFWHLYGPSCVRLFGHIPQGGLWKGEPINPQLFAQWKAWCHSPECSPAVLAGGADQPHHYDEVTAKIRSFGYRDDPIANEKTVPMVLSVYPKAECEEAWAAPSDFGLAKIGHEGLFSRKAAKAWAPVWDWLLGE
ncbi:MAG: hypothetical protein KDK70_09505 [Myxococcales bacterium]|nr:hypothetical protein [Myxococcales bacterium]